MQKYGISVRELRRGIRTPVIRQGDELINKSVESIMAAAESEHFELRDRDIAHGMKKIVFMLSYLSDEVGNQLFDEDLLDEKGINPWTDVLDERQYREAFGFYLHAFTGVGYVRLDDILDKPVDGSGDKGTPVVLIQGYFDSFAEENTGI